VSKLPLWGPPELGAGSALGPRQPVLRVAGFPAGSPEAQLLADAHSGELKNFYLGQSRNHALGTVEYTSKTIERDGVRYQYTNQSGQEIVTMEVHPKKAEQILKLEPVSPWGWCLLEIRVPLAGSATHARFRAQRKVPAPREAGVINEALVEDTVPPPGNADGLTPPVTKYPEGLDALVDVREGNSQSSTLYVDLRRFSGGPVAIDIFGYLDVTSHTEEVLAGYSAPTLVFPAPTYSTSSGSYDYNVTGGALLSMSLWPEDVFAYAFSGVTPTPGPDGLESQAISVGAAPRAPLSLAYQPGSAMPMPASGGSPQRTLANRHYTASYDPVSGIATSVTIEGIDITFGGASTVIHSGETHEHGAYNYATFSVTATRDVTPYYDDVTVPDPAENTAEARIVGGWGELRVVERQVTNDVTTFSEFCTSTPDGLRAIPTFRLRDDVVISGPSAGSDTDNHIGTLVVDPKTHSAAFNLA
jgi:hypothetical protein